MSTVYQMVTRVLMDQFFMERRRFNSASLLNHIAAAADGVDQFFLKGSVDFLSEIPHVHVHYVGAAFKIVIPDVFLDAASGKHHAFVVHHVFQDGVLLGGKGDFRPGPRDLVGGEIHDKIPEHKPVGGLIGAAP